MMYEKLLDQEFRTHSPNECLNYEEFKTRTQEEMRLREGSMKILVTLTFNLYTVLLFYH